MKNSRQQNTRFAVLALLVQTVMWLVFTFYDYGFDERHLVNNRDLTDWLGLFLLICLLLLPVAAYFMLKKKYLFTEHPFRDGIIRILCWAAVCLLISWPIVWAVDMDVWIVPQNRSGFMSLDGLEYYFIPVIDCLIPPLAIIISLLTAAVRKIYRATGRRVDAETE